MSWALLLLTACGPADPEGTSPADLLPLHEDGRAWVYEATPACGCAEEGLLRVHTLEAGDPSTVHTAMECPSCGELSISAWIVSADDDGILAWGFDTLEGDVKRYDPPVQVEDGLLEAGAVLSTETGGTTWLSELLTWEPCPVLAVDAECARYLVQPLAGVAAFPAGTWWLAEGLGIVGFVEGRGADEPEWAWFSQSE